jgi:uncharacterized membrane protein YqiK
MITYLTIAGTILVVLITIGLILTRLYKRANKETSFVRTGFGGEKVVMNGGALVLPVLHETINVNMKTLKLQVKNKEKDSLITADKLRVDIETEFYVRVAPNKDSIAIAAQTLGHKTTNLEELKKLIEGKFVDALRSVAISLPMETLLKERSDFILKVQEVLTEDLIKNGLELEAAALTYFDQTAIEYYDPNNIMDAEGLTLITKQTEKRKKERNEITRDTEIAIQEKDLKTKQESLNFKLTEAEAEAQQQAKIAEEEALRRKEAEEANIRAEQEIEKAKIEKEKALEKERIEKEKALKIAEQLKSIEISEKSEEEFAARAKANEARAKEVESEERVKTARETEEANRDKALTLIKANEKAEEQAIQLTVSAKAEKEASIDRAEALKLEAQGKADSIKIEAEANEIKYEVEAEGKRKLNAAENSLSTEIIEMRIKEALINRMPEIIKEVVAPMQNIDSIKIVDMGGISKAIGSDGNIDKNSETLPNQMVNAALRQSALNPLVQEFSSAIGMDFSTIDGATAPLKGILTPKEETPKEEIFLEGLSLDKEDMPFLNEATQKEDRE